MILSSPISMTTPGVELSLIEDLSVFHGSETHVEWVSGSFKVRAVLLHKDEFDPHIHRSMSNKFDQIGVLLDEAISKPTTDV